MSSKLRNYVKKYPIAVSLYQLLRDRSRSLAASMRRISTKRAFPPIYFDAVFKKAEDPWSYKSDHQQERQRLLLEIIPNTAETILEVGCAEGMITQKLAQQQRAVVALDISAQALRRAKQRCGNNGGISFVRADLLHLPFGSCFESVLCAGVLCYFPEPDLFLRAAQAIENVVAPGGVLVLEHFWNPADGTLSGKKIHEHFLSNPRFECANHFIRDEYGISVFRRMT